MWYLVTLSMPNSGIEPHGKVTASATPFSMMSRTSGADEFTLVPPSCVIQVAIVACAGRIFMPLMSPGTRIFLVLEWNEPGSWKNAKQNFTSFISFSAYFRHRDLLGLGMERARIMEEREAELHVLHLLLGIFAVPLVERAGAFLGVRHHERQVAGVDDREAAGLVAGADVGDVGDAVARHVVMVERLVELLRGKHLRLDGAVRGLLDRAAPVLERLLQRMRRRHPVRQAQLKGLVLRGRGGGAQCQDRTERRTQRSEEHTSELQSRGLISYAVFC